jgi:hypothetical protein
MLGLWSSLESGVAIVQIPKYRSYFFLIAGTGSSSGMNFECGASIFDHFDDIDCSLLLVGGNDIDMWSIAP